MKPISVQLAAAMRPLFQELQRTHLDLVGANKALIERNKELRTKKQTLRAASRKLSEKTARREPTPGDGAERLA